MAHRHKHHKAHGGGVNPKHDPDKMEYNKSPVEKEAKSEKDGFKRGGKMKKHAAGGRIVGRASGGRLDKRARGGKVGGHSPFSSAHVKGHAGPATHPHPHISKG